MMFKPRAEIMKIKTVIVFLTAIASVASAKPNIVLILADDLGVECLSSYGGQSHRTPHLDRLAKEGMRFTQSFSNPYCSPSRGQLLTGRYPFQNGLKVVLHSKKQENIYLRPSQPSFVRQLKQHGYWQAAHATTSLISRTFFQRSANSPVPSCLTRKFTVVHSLPSYSANPALHARGFIFKTPMTAKSETVTICWITKTNSGELLSCGRTRPSPMKTKRRKSKPPRAKRCRQSSMT